jgi:hypothetical protein
MDYSMDSTDNHTIPMRADELTLSELDAVGGGGTNSSYNVFYTLGYWFGEATSWVSNAIATRDRYFAQEVEQSNGAILAYL